MEIPFTNPVSYTTDNVFSALNVDPEDVLFETKINTGHAAMHLVMYVLNHFVYITECKLFIITDVVEHKEFSKESLEKYEKLFLKRLLTEIDNA